MLRVIICDDDVRFLSTMVQIVDDIVSQFTCCAKIHSYTNFEQIGQPILASCDIALLDIDFADKKYNGLAIARQLRSLRPDAIIIFITNYIEYAPEGYEVKAFRYLLKKDVQVKLRDYLLFAFDALAASKEMLKIKICGEIIDLRLRKIVYIESKLRMVDVHMEKNKLHDQGKVYSYYATMSELEKQLAPLGFLRIHKSYLVNMKFIRYLRNREVLLCDGTTLPVGGKNYAEKKKKYLMWKGYH